MKRFYHILIHIAIVPLFIACSDSDVSEQFGASIMGHYLTISVNNLSFSSEGGLQVADISSNQTPWRFTDYPSWLNIAPAQGLSSSSVSFTASENLSSDTTRTSIFYFCSDDDSWTYRNYISVYQAAASAYLNLDKSTLLFTGASSSQIVNVSSNTKYVTNCADSWVKCKIADDGNSISVSVEENTTGQSRTTSVFIVGSINKTISITQQAADMTGETSTLTFGCDGGNHNITFTSETAWSATTSSVWINVSPENGIAGKNTLTISAAPNSSTSERQDYVYLKIGSTTKLQIPVRQDGIYIRTNSSKLSFDPFECKRTLIVESNTDWEILSHPDWVTISTKGAKGDKEIEITALENPDIYLRTGVIKIGQKGFSYVVEVSIEQAAMNINTEETQIQFSDVASTITINITTEGTWTATSEDTWIHVNPISGFGNANLSISVDENTAESDRKGNVYVKVGNTTKQILINQSGKFFSYSNDNLEIGSTGGIINITLKTNEKWIISKDDDVSWISFSESSGSGDACINLAIADNPSVKERQCSVSILPANSQPVSLKIRQAARYLTVDHTSLSFFAKGGTSELITINTDGAFEIKKDQDWISINQNENTFTVTASQSNLLESRNANVTIHLIGLNDGESYSIAIPIIQKAVSEHFGGDDYDDDEDWNF